MSLLGLDVGTTGTKAVVFAEDGRVLAQGYREYPLIHPRPDWVELDPNGLWERVSEVIVEVSAVTGADPIEAVAVSSQGEGVVPIDNNGNTLHNIVVTFDNRTLPQFAQWKRDAGAEYVFGITGMPLHPMYSVNKWMWFAQSTPDVHENTYKYLCVEDFIVHRLTGETAIGYSLAARTMAFDVRQRRWSSEILRIAGITESLLSKAVPSGEPVGAVRPELAAELGLNPGVKVVSGGHDQACGALGAGIMREGMAVNSTGTVDVLCPAFSSCTLDEAMLRNNFCCYPHSYEEMYISVAFNLSGGQLLRWYRDIICADEVRRAAETHEDPYDLIIREASPDPANVFILPHLAGAGTPTLDPKSLGAIAGLSISTGKAELTRAVLDGINYEMKRNIDGMAESGVEIDELRAIGGGARSARWLQMKADVFGKEVSSMEVSEAAALGAAILAGTGIGRFSGADEGVRQMVRIGRTYTPKAEEGEKHRERYQLYLELQPSLSEIHHRIHDFYAVSTR